VKQRENSSSEDLEDNSAVPEASISEEVQTRDNEQNGLAQGHQNEDDDDAADVDGDAKKKRRKKKKKKVIKGVPLSGWRPLTSQKEARKVTSKFHELTRDLEKLDASTGEQVNLSNKQRQEERVKIQAQLNELGGRERYQEASILLTSLNKSSSKWVFQNITKLGMRPSKGSKPLQVLEVGAINTQLVSCPWLDVLAIDIKSRHPLIKELDFFKVPIKPAARFDVICNAMVVNCVPTPEARGEMLVRCTRLLKKNGLFCFVLPQRCVGQPSTSGMLKIMKLLGFEVFNTSESPKISFFAGRKIMDCWHEGESNSETLTKYLNKVNMRAQDPAFAVTFSEKVLAECCCCKK